MDDNQKKKASSGAAALAMLVGVSGFANMVQADFNLPYGTPTTVNAHGVCYVVTNTAGPNKFVATTTASEWSNFVSTHGTATLSSCGLGQGDGGCGYCGDGGDGGPGG